MYTLIIRTQFEGFHSWPTAPQEVDYLQSRHRHLFKVEMEVIVGRPDRMLEFHTLKKDLDETIARLTKDWATANDSCETMAEKFAIDMIGKKLTVARMSVSEDGEFDGVFLPDMLNFK